MAAGRLWRHEQPGALSGRQVLIFDFDGTVADTTPLHAQAFTEVLGERGVPVHYPDIAGLKTQDALRACLSQAGQPCAEADVELLTQRKQQRARQLITEGLQPLPGVHAFLLWARPRYRLAMATSGSRGTVSLALAVLGYTGWFDPLVCADDVPRAKPAPDLFLAALGQTRLSATAALVFEDAPAGLQAARAAGIDHVDVRGINWLTWREQA
jgi:HAD superfamily hydrolase (TIGR01509 family)